MEQCGLCGKEYTVKEQKEHGVVTFFTKQSRWACARCYELHEIFYPMIYDFLLPSGKTASYEDRARGLAIELVKIVQEDNT